MLQNLLTSRPDYVFKLIENPEDPTQLERFGASLEKGEMMLFGKRVSSIRIIRSAGAIDKEYHSLGNHQSSEFLLNKLRQLLSRISTIMNEKKYYR